MIDVYRPLAKYSHPLEISPLSVHKRAHQAYTEIRSYIEELRDWKQSSTRNGSVVSDPSLLGELESNNVHQEVG